MFAKTLSAVGVVLVVAVCALSVVLLSPLGAGSDDYIEYLKQRSVLLQAPALEQAFSRQGAQWHHPYGLARPEDFLSLSSAWLSVYPAAIIGRRGDSVLQTLSDPALLQTIEAVGIDAIHTGPMKRSGSIVGKQYYPTIDGHFDRIELTIDPDFGTQAQYQRFVRTAGAHGIALIGDLVPGHTGKGPDFRLAERNVPGFPGIYSMVEVRPKDWSLLPAVPEGKESVGLSLETVQTLEERGYIVGPLDAVIFARPGIKESNWSATAVVTGVDGTKRRWVYLHLFKRGQPSLNWLDPTFAAQRLLTADMLHSLKVLGAQGLRLDATMFLGIGPGPDDQKGWLSGHPLSNHATSTVAMMIRKFGGFSFQEQNVDLDTLKEAMLSGSDLSYDFATRPGYLYAIVTGDAGPLRLMLREMLAYGVRPMRLVHALQNHDELMLEITHLRMHGDKLFVYEGKRVEGRTLFAQVHRRPIRAATGDHAPYNASFAMSPGVCSTFAGLVAATIGVEDLTTITPEQIDQIRNAHLVAAAYNALQPGAFALSAWDLVGALPVPREAVLDLLADNDCRWLNRGAYDLTGVAPTSTESSSGLPRAVALYGPLPDQLETPRSFASRLKEMLAIRKALAIAQARLVAVPRVINPGLLLLVNELPHGESARFQLTAVNFGRSVVEEVILDDRMEGGTTRAIFSTRRGAINEALRTEGIHPVVRLEPLEAKIIIRGKGPIGKSR